MGEWSLTRRGHLVHFKFFKVLIQYFYGYSEFAADAVGNNGISQARAQSELVCGLGDFFNLFCFLRPVDGELFVAIYFAVGGVCVLLARTARAGSFNVRAERIGPENGSGGISVEKNYKFLDSV